MEAKAKSLTFLGNEGLVRIPFFQRGYVWKEANWQDLLTDLLNASKNHFLGSLILKQQRTLSGEPKEVLVIDGQQRLTTLSILVKALYDSFNPDLQKNCINVIRHQLFHKKYQTDSDFLIKIQHSQIDAGAFQKVIRSNIDAEKLPIDDAHKNKIIRCYGYFMQALKKNSEEEKKRLFNGILDSENKMLVVIDLAENDDEQSIFDTINSAGVRLSSADIIKNSIFQRAIQIFEDQDDVSKLYQATWEKVFLSDDETIRFWETPRLTGRFMRDNIEILLHSIAVIKGFYDPDKNTLSDLSKLYKTRISSYKTKEDLVALANEIKDYAQIYRDRFLSLDGDTLYSFDDGINRLFHLLDGLQISTFHPFILNIFKTKANDEAYVTKVLRNLEVFVLRRVVSNQETKSFNKLCRDFIDDPTLISTKLGETADENVSAGLTDISNKLAALLLFWIELYRRSKDRKFDLKELKYDYSLEHIMPQKWEEHWVTMPKKIGLNGSEMSLEEAKKDRYEKVYWIGNMTLLNSSLNSALRNHVFDKKMNGENRKRGIRAYSSLSITRDDIVTPYESGTKTWDETNIIERTKNLTKEILEIWKP